ncbi:MAG: hypothetical protein H0U73_04990 [Tatlockia sp.]|nr:hypothetical protein [Tatlockia sp.]
MSVVNKQEIERIFKVMLAQAENAEDVEMKKLLLNYELILKREEDFLDRPDPLENLDLAEKNHPLDSALTLQACVSEYYKMRADEENSFFEKLSYFRATASNSKFYPNARIAAAIISASLLIFSAVLLGGLILSAPYTVPLIVYVVAAIVVAGSFPMSSMLIGKSMTYFYQPIYNSEDQANTFFLNYDNGKKSKQLPESFLNGCSLAPSII